jgi:tetratricopeptide (TPR) repeat protein
MMVSWAFLAVSGCGHKIVKKGMVFGLDGLFGGPTARRDDSDAQPWREKGRALADKKDYQQAIEAFKRCVEEEPEDFFGYNAIAICQKNAGDSTSALKSFERALEFAEQPEDQAKILSNIGNLYFSSNKPQAALGYYKEASALSEENPLYHALIARNFIVLKEFERAQKVLANAEKLPNQRKRNDSGDDAGLAYHLFAHCYAALGEEQKVFDYLELAFKANPDKLVGKVIKDVEDQGNIFYTLKDHPKTKELIRKYKGNQSSSVRLPKQ